MPGLAYYVARAKAAWRCDCCANGRASYVFLHCNRLLVSCDNCYRDCPL